MNQIAKKLSASSAILGLLLAASPSVFAASTVPSNYIPTNNTTNQAPPATTPPPTQQQTQQSQSTQNTQHMGGGGGITGTTGLGSTNTSGTPVTTTTGGTHIINLGTISQEIILGSQESQPSLTVIDANPNQNSQSNTCFDPTQCPGQNKPAKPDVASLALTFLIGVSFAGILWYISLRNLGMSFMLRGDSQIQRMKKNKQQYLEQQSLLKTYKKIAFAISMANNHTDALAYKEATAELEIFGSTKTVDANKILTSLLADPKANNIDIANAKNYLVHCIRTDLGLN